MEADRDPVARPGDSGHATGAPRARVGILGDPRRPSEVLEPQSRQELVDRATAPPLVDLGDEAAMVSLDRPTEVDRIRHRAATHAATTAAATSTGTSSPKTSPR